MVLKYKVGDKVVVVQLNPVICEIGYDQIGEEYKNLHFQCGIIYLVHDSYYTVEFDSKITWDKRWSFKEQELMSLEEYEKANKATLKVLYGSKEV